MKGINLNISDTCCAMSLIGLPQKTICAVYGQDYVAWSTAKTAFTFRAGQFNLNDKPRSGRALFVTTHGSRLEPLLDVMGKWQPRNSG